MKVLLIGANGQLGRDIFRTKPADPAQADLLLLDKQCLDITNRDKTFQTLKDKRPDILINTAAYVRVDDAEDNTEEAFRINAIGVKNLVDACNETDAIFFHISTDYVFDGQKNPLPYDEHDKENPLNVYGITKYAGELFIKNYASKFYIARTASLYGKAGASGKGGNFVFTVLDKIKKCQTMKIVNDMHMSPTCTYDLAQEIWRLIIEKSPYGLYHIANSGHCTWYEFAKTISLISGTEGEIIPVSHREYNTKAMRPLWSPLISVKGIKLRRWEEALETFLKEIL